MCICRAWAAPGARIIFYLLPTVRSVGMGTSLLLERVAQPGWRGAAADVARVLAGGPTPVCCCSRALMLAARTTLCMHACLSAGVGCAAPISMCPCALAPAGTRLIALVVGGCALPMPPAVTLLTQTALLLLVRNGAAYCSCPVSLLEGWAAMGGLACVFVYLCRPPVPPPPLLRVSDLAACRLAGALWVPLRSCWSTL